MTIKKKIQQVIEKGANVAKDAKDDEWKTYCLRIRTSTMKQIEDSIDTSVSQSKNAWILQAIHEKLKRFSE